MIEAELWVQLACWVGDEMKYSGGGAWQVAILLSLLSLSWLGRKIRTSWCSKELFVFLYLCTLLTLWVFFSFQPISALPQDGSTNTGVTNLHVLWSVWFSTVTSMLVQDRLGVWLFDALWCQRNWCGVFVSESISRVSFDPGPSLLGTTPAGHRHGLYGPCLEAEIFLIL
jgi:hypothetical protein